MRSTILSLLGVVGLAASASGQTDIPWLAGSGNWSVPANWTSSNVPNDTSERAVISAGGSYTVSVDTSFTVNGLLIPNPSATVQIIDARLLAFGGASPIIDQTGNIVINPTGGGNGTYIQFNSSGTIQGGGAVILNAHPANLDTAYLQTSGPVTITNAPLHFIRGTGSIHGAMINDGFIVADVDTRALRLLSSPKTNNARIEARSGGTLVISGITLTQSAAAHVRAEAGSFVVITGAAIIDGTVEAQGTGLVQITGSSTFTGVDDLLGNLHVLDARTLIINDGIRNRGTITVNPTAGGNATLVQFNNSGSFIGDGQVILNSHPANLDTAYVQTSGGAVITQEAPHAIRGTGNIHGTLINNGVVSANVAGRTLQLLTTPKTNNATIEAINGATLQISGILVTQNAPGRLLADASTLNLNSCAVTGGEISAINGGIVRVVNSSTLNNLIVQNGPLEILDARTLVINGGLNHNGTITINPSAGGNGTLLQFNSSGTLSGAGEIVLNAHPLNPDTSYLQTSGASVMTNGSTHLVRGTGRIHATFVNDGTVRADVAGRAIELLAANKTNNATMQAVGGATLQISSITLAQGPTGVLSADNATLNLNACAVIGGTIVASNGGVTRVINSSTLTDVASATGPIEINDARTLVVNGGLVHTGTITVNPAAGGNGTLLQFNNSGTLGGTGDVLLNAHPANPDTSYLQTSGAAVMTNGATHLVHGTGRIHGNFANDGIVRADVSGRTLELLTTSKTNNNLMEAVNSGVLQISSVALTQGASALLSADNATLNLNACAVVNGSIRATGTGLIQVIGSSTLTNITSIDGPMNINDARTLVVNGGLSHTGTVTVNPSAGGNGTVMQFNTTSDLSGNGRVLLNAHPGNLDTAYLTTAGAAVMSNAPGHTVAGRGRIYGNFTNNGTLSPGDDNADRTNFLQRMGNLVCGPTSQVIADLDGTVQGSTYDWLHTTGSYTLDGSLVVRLAPGYIPPRNTVFTVVSGGARIGQFSSVTLPTLPPSLGYPRIEYTLTEVRVRVPQCPTDWNARDGLNSQDFFDFLNDFFSGNGDVNFDGVVNSQDFFDFLTSFFGGCEG